MAIATTQPISVSRNESIVKNFPQNHEQVMHDIYRYAVITDSVEGLVLVDIDTMADGEFRNNRLKRALTWNEGNVLAGARHVTLAGRSEEHTSELQSLMRISYAVFCLKKTKKPPILNMHETDK